MCSVIVLGIQKNTEGMKQATIGKGDVFDINIDERSM